MKYEVIVKVKDDVLDPEGRAITESLQRLGVSELENIEVSKRYLLTMNAAQCSHQKVEDIVKEYLATSVAETYIINKL